MRETFGGPVSLQWPGEYEIPSLSVYETALFVRDVHRLVLLVIASLLQKGALTLSDAPVLKLQKGPGEGLDGDETGFLRVIDGEGRIDPVELNDYVETLAQGLAYKIWLSDKVLLRHFLEDKIELFAEAPAGKALSLPDSLWPLLHGDLDDGKKYCAHFKPGGETADGGERDALPLLLYRELAMSSLFPETLLDILNDDTRGRHEPAAFSPNLLVSLYEAEDALARFSLQTQGYCRHSLSEPYRQAVVKLEHIGTMQNREKWDLAIARCRGFWEGRIQELSRLIEEEERALTAHEDMVDYFHIPGNLNPVLKDREESVKMQREILSREVFQLRASRQKYQSPLSRVLNWKEVHAIAIRLKEKERALAAVTLEFHAVRQEWEKERREMLRNDPSLLRHWRRRLVSIGRLKMEKGFMHSHLDFLAMESAARQFVIEWPGAHLCEAGAEALRAMGTLLKETGMLEKRLLALERTITPLARAAAGQPVSHDESQAEKILYEFRRCIDGFSYKESEMLWSSIRQCHGLLDRLDISIEAAQRRAPGQGNAPAREEHP